jgi:hypothetical protein
MPHLRSSLFAWCLALVSASGAIAAGDPTVRMVDAFDDASGWSAHPADGVEMAIHSDEGPGGKAMRIDFDFQKGGGYAVARKSYDIDLPGNYAFVQLRGTAPPTTSSSS